MFLLGLLGEQGNECITSNSSFVVVSNNFWINDCANVVLSLLAAMPHAAKGWGPGGYPEMKSQLLHGSGTKSPGDISSRDDLYIYY